MRNLTLVDIPLQEHVYAKHGNYVVGFKKVHFAHGNIFGNFYLDKLVKVEKGIF